MSTYKPTEHGGLKENGEPDGRVGTGQFAQGKVDPHQAGAEGGRVSGSGSGSTGSSGGDNYKPTEHDGLTKDGKPDGRVGTGEFAHGQVDPHEAGAAGGSATGGSTGGSSGESTGNSGGSGTGGFAHGKVDPVEAGRKGGAAS
ncbi:hypothetical protein ACMFMG_010544 [Clarireedia jacksonii]